MEVNEYKSIVINKPYGMRGQPPNVPGGADLIFEITLISIETGNNINVSLLSDE